MPITNLSAASSWYSSASCIQEPQVSDAQTLSYPLLASHYFLPFAHSWSFDGFHSRHPSARHLINMY